MRRLATIGLLLAAPVLVALVVAEGNGSALDTLAQAICTQADLILPTGQVSPSPSGDPLIPTYCVSAAPTQPTRVTGANDWIDVFGTLGVNRFVDGDMDYRVFDREGGVAATGHLIVGDHWIDDNKVQFGGGAYVRPNRSFHFEQGKLVIEGDFAAGKIVYHGNQWGEMLFSTSDHPDTGINDELYAYGRFYGNWAVGCRFQDPGTIVCAAHNGSSFLNPTLDTAPCFSNVPDRLWELSYFQGCGNYNGGVHFGGFSDASRSIYRSCEPTQDYDPCLDRFRMEITKTSLVIYVNGFRYFEDSGWPAANQLGDDLINSPVYVYFADWGTVSPDPVYRFHWERLAVNPHDAAGNLLPPSPSPSFTGPQPPAPNTPTATPTTAAVATSTATPTPTPSQPPTVTPSAAATMSPTPTSSPPPTASPTPTSPPPTASPTPTITPRPPSPTPTPTPTAGSGSGQFQPFFLTFDALPNPGRVLNGQYPTNLIDWGTNNWWLSGPYGRFPTTSISFNGSGPTDASFAFIGPRTLWSLEAYNGGSIASKVQISCPGLPTARAYLGAGQMLTIVVGWTRPCPTVTIFSSNGWDTNFNNLKIK